MPPAWKARSLNHWIAREVPGHRFFRKKISISRPQLTIFHRKVGFVICSEIKAILDV